jgi:hypothetical protein
MKTERSALQALKDGVLDRGLVRAWERLAPLSAGSVASGIAILAGRSLLRRALGSRGGRALGWLGALALLPIGLWWLSESEAPGPAGDDSEITATQRRPRKRDGGRKSADSAE